MDCEHEPGPIILQQLERTGLELPCYNFTNVTYSNESEVPDLEYYLCRLLKNHAYVPAKEQRLTHDAMMVYTSNIIALLGIVLNILTICVLARERRYSPSIFLLQCLSVVDTLFLVLNLLNFGIPTLIIAAEGVTCAINPYIALKLNAYRNNLIVGKIMNQLAQSMRVMAVGMMVLVTTDRCLAIFYPLHAKRFCTFAAAKTEVFLLSVYTLVWFAVFNVLDYVDNSHKFRAFAVSSIVNLIIPAAIVFVLNLRLIRTLQVSKRMRSTMDASANGGRNSGQHSFEYASLTAKLVAIASTFSICVVPSIIIAVNWMLTTNLGTNCCLSVDTISKVNLVAILAMNFNSAVNFFFYIMMGWRFRRAFFEMMCGLCLKDYRSEAIAMKNVGMSCASKTQMSVLIHRGSASCVETNALRRASETSARYDRC